MAQSLIVSNGVTGQFIPSKARIYLSYVLGNGTERANRTILNRDEIKNRMIEVKVNRNEFIRVTQPEYRAAYDQFAFDVRYSLHNRIRIKLEPINDDADQ